MATNDPIDPAVRLAISQWPDDAPRGAVTGFCNDHGIARQTFYKILNIARNEGQASALAPKSRRPTTSPTVLPASITAAVLAARSALDEEGWDNGPISIHDRLILLGFHAPSPTSVARILRREGVSTIQPQKRPRSSYRRFRAPAPNVMWQIDATGYVLSGGRTCTIFQVLDDHSRLALASLVAKGETSAAAVQVVTTAIDRHGVPQKFLSDNGTALNPTRRGIKGKLVTFLESLGVEPITSLPAHPTTQGKNERFHQTLFTWLGQKPLANSIAEMQEMVDQFDHLYNTERRHQGIPGRITPQQSWDATPVAQAPRPEPVSVPINNEKQPGEDVAAAFSYPAIGDTGRVSRRVDPLGRVRLRKIVFKMPRGTPPRQTITVAWDQETVVFVSADGTVIAERAWPPEGVTNVGSGDPPGRAPRDGTVKRKRKGRRKE